MADSARKIRRTAGMIVARLAELRLPDLADKRCKAKWKLPVIITALLVGLMAGSKSLAMLEQGTACMPQVIRRKLRIHRRIPDTTVRDIACSWSPATVRSLLHRQTRAAHRRKALSHPGMPFGIMAVDGKTILLPSVDDHLAQRQTADGKLRGALRIMTCALVTAPSCPCVDAIPILAQTNEMGSFVDCLSELHHAYGSLDLFRMVSADAGNCSRDNAQAVRGFALHYLFGLKDNQPCLKVEAERCLGELQLSHAVASTVDCLASAVVEERHLHITDQMAGFDGWDHLRTVLCVVRTRRQGSRLLLCERRYFISSLPSSRLTPSQWLRAIRLHWMVENGCHWTLDTILHEDDHPWIESDPQGAFAIAVLRRLAYNILAMHRQNHQPSHHTDRPWKQLVRWVEATLLMATEQLLDGLRQRPLVAFS